ncbi:MAG: SCO family protein, partial [Myxococcota bacterium]
GSPAAAGEPSSRATYTGETEGPVDRIDKLPVEAQGIKIDEKVGETLALDAEFFDTDGKRVKLGDYFDGELPVVLTFNYSNCPMLCSLQLNAMLEAIKGDIPYKAGRQYKIISIVLDPAEKPESARITRDKYADTFAESERDSVRAGWSFLTGDESAIKAAADSAGVHYRYYEKTGEYLHPASLIFVSPNGVITRYYHGIHYVPDEVGKSIFMAGAGEYGVSIGFLLACFRIGEHSDYAAMGENIMRYGALAFLVAILAIFGLWMARRSREPEPVEAGKSSAQE